MGCITLIRMCLRLINTHYTTVLLRHVGWQLLQPHGHKQLTTNTHRSRKRCTQRRNFRWFVWVHQGRINWICYLETLLGYPLSFIIIHFDLLISKNRHGSGNRLRNARRSALLRLANNTIWTLVLCGRPVLIIV